MCKHAHERTVGTTTRPVGGCEFRFSRASSLDRHATYCIASSYKQTTSCYHASVKATVQHLCSRNRSRWDKAMFSPSLFYDLSGQLAIPAADLISNPTTTGFDNFELMSMVSVLPPSPLNSLYPSSELMFLPQMFPLAHTYAPLVPSLINLVISPNEVQTKQHSKTNSVSLIPCKN